MLMKTAASVLRSVLYRPSLVLIFLLVVPLVVFFNGPKAPPIPQGQTLQAVQKAQPQQAGRAGPAVRTPPRAAGALCTPGAQRSRCLGSGIAGQPCHFYSCDTCGSDGKWWGLGIASSTPCAVPASDYVAVEDDAGPDYVLPPWHARYGDVDEP